MPYRPDIQGLRAIAVLAVMLFHYNPAWLPGGFVGVDVFLVISGFLISSILLHKKAQPNYRLASTLNYFYSSRLKRIVPAYFGMLILVSLVAAVLFLPQDLNTYQDGLEDAVWFNSNNYFANFGDYFAPASHEQPLLHTWSLAVEIQFYLIAPFILLLLPRRLLSWLLPLSIIALTGYAEYRLRIQGNEQATYYSLIARLPAFLLGAWVALMIEYRNEEKEGNRIQLWLSWAAAGLIAVAIYWPKTTGFFPGIAGLVPTIGAALILLYPVKGGLRKLLANKAMVWIGALSYSLYLWHWPVLAFLRYYTGAEVLDTSFSLMFITLTFLLASSSFYWIEVPLRAKKTGFKQTIGYVGIACLALGTSKSMATVNQVLSSEPLPIEYRRYADPDIICHGQIVGDCLRGDLSSEREVLVLGDSHAAMLNHFFDNLGEELGFRARIITASSCVTIPGFDYKRIPEWAHEACLEQIKQAQQHLIDAKVIFLAASWHWQLTSDDFQYALSRFLAAQSQAGSKIYFLEQEPLLSKNPLRALRFKTLGLEPSITIDPAYQQANASLQQLAANHSTVTSLNFEPSGVFAQAPFADGILIYLDEHHLNEAGAKRYADVARNAFNKILN